MGARENALKAMKAMLNNEVNEESIQLAKKGATIIETTAKKFNEKNPLLEERVNQYNTHDNGYDEREPEYGDIGERLEKYKNTQQTENRNGFAINESAIDKLMAGKSVKNIREEMDYVSGEIFDNTPLSTPNKPKSNPYNNSSNFDISKMKQEIMDELKNEFKSYIKDEVFNVLTYEIFSKERQKSLLKEILIEHKAKKQ